MSSIYDDVTNPDAEACGENVTEEKQPSVNKWNRNGYGQAIEPTTGKYSPAESQAVKTAIEQYCSTHSVTPARLCSESDNRTDHLRGAWMDIAKNLPHRTVQSVYRHGLRLMHPFKRGIWSEQESKDLLRLVTVHGKKWSEIQNKLNRSADSCRDKFREFDSNYTKGKWFEAESSQLEMYVRSFMKVERDIPVAQLGIMAEQKSVQIPWSAISKKMKNRSRLSCFKRFQQMAGLKKSSAERRRRRDVPDATLPEPSVTITTAAAAPVTLNLEPATTQVVADPHAMAMTTTPNPIQADAVHLATLVAAGQKQDTTSLSVPDPTTESSDRTSYDRTLIQSLAASSYQRESDVHWSSFQYPLGDVRERWHELVDKWMDALEGAIDEDEIMDAPVYEVAKMMMENEVVEDQAEMAARTVEAVFLC